MAERQLPKLRTRVRFPSPAPFPTGVFHRFTQLGRLSHGWRFVFTRTAGIQRGPAVASILATNAS